MPAQLRHDVERISLQRFDSIDLGKHVARKDQLTAEDRRKIAQAKEQFREFGKKPSSQE